MCPEKEVKIKVSVSMLRKNYFFILVYRKRIGPERNQTRKDPTQNNSSHTKCHIDIEFYAFIHCANYSEIELTFENITIKQILELLILIK